MTAIPCPIGTLPIVEPDHWSSGSTKPGLSPGKSMPVVLAEAEAVDPLASRSPPSFSASVIAPTLDECERICATVIVSVPRGSASWMIAVGDRDAVRQRELACRASTSPSESAAGDRDELERRPRLVRVGDGAVALQLDAATLAKSFAS